MERKLLYSIISLLLLASFTGFAQVIATSYKGAFAPAPIPMWTDNWTNYDPNNAVYGATTVNIDTNITANTTWTADKVYKLSGQIFVTGGATLTIQPGTVIRADIDPLLKSALIITKGSKINAEGTVTNPIVFTSGNAAGSRLPGDWGGLILLGKGAYNGTSTGINNIEGLVVSTDSQFGGGLTPDNADNSGILKYVRIEFGGILLSANNEINGLTFGAVGSGTTVDNVQVSFANDDSFEWFGGAVNCKHIIAYRGVDDDFDTDNGYSGTVQFCLAVRDPKLYDATYAATSGASTSEGFESDNNAAGDISTPITSAIFTNATMVGPAYRTTLLNGGTYPSGSFKRAARLRRNSQLKIFNSIFMDYVEGLHVDNSGSAPNGASELNALNNTLKFKNNILAGITTSAKIVQISTSGTHAAGFDIATWFNASNNTGLSTAITNSGILTSPYNLVDGSIYTGLDYRPATSSIALTGANFTDASLGTDNFIESSEFSLVVYPNPSASTFKLNYFSSNNEDVKVEAYDLNGRMLESRNVEYAEINNQEIGNGYTAGVYIVVLKQGNISKTVKVIKN